MKETILIADDDPMLLRLLSDILKKQGYSVLLAKNGEEAIDLFFNTKNISLCILDVMMPIYTGYQVLETLREHSDLSVIMLTALGEENNELQGFRTGADDYISKPFSHKILLARVESLLKKKRKQEESSIELGDMVLDQRGHCLRVQGEGVSLTPKEYDLITLFALHKGQVFSREQLLSKIWGYDYEGEIRTVDTHIKMLRKKLGSCGDCIVTVRGTGYKLQVTYE